MADQHRCGAPAADPLDPAAVEQSLTERFRRFARAHGGCLAVEDAEQRLTYGELDARADGVAAAVAACRGEAVEPVVLLFGQGVPSVVATLGTLAAGRPYVPLDPSDPPARLVEMAALVGARLALAEDADAAASRALRAAGLEVMSAADALAGPAPAPGPAPGPDTPACIYFTSGSTGGPKGVLDVHRNVLHNAARYTATLGVGSSDRLSLIQSPAFSGVVSSTFAALLNGAALFPMRIDGGRVGALAAEIKRRRITIYHSVPSIFRSMVAVDGGTFPDVRVVRLEGDRASSADLALHRGHFPAGSVLANGLGTTETGLCRQFRVAAGHNAPDGVLPVGYAVPGVEVEVVDPAGRPLPPGRAGEIAVKGRHLALGYWGRPELTAAAFSHDAADPGLRVYRTGDLGRMSPDGCLELLGRLDGGLKVLGQRVEPAEVEGHLLALPGVLEAAVTTYPGRRGEGRLAAHLVVDGRGLDHLGIRQALVERLPAAMVPATIVFVNSLPVTSGGKLDRAALVPAPPAGATVPRHALEEMVMDVWSEVLERRDFGVDDEFLALGGDSLAAAEVLAALEDRVGRPVSESLLIRAPTVAAMAAEMAGGGWAVAGLAPLQPRGDGLPLVLVHGLDFSTNTYAWLVRRLGSGRPVWGLDADRESRGSIGDLAAGHAAALRDARPGGPHLIAGFCSGAIVAMEVARRLRAAGDDVALLALIGVSDADLPALVAPAAARRGRAARRAPVAERLRGVRAAVGRRVRDGRDPFAHALARHVPAPLPGGATLYLSAEATAVYSRDPGNDWAGLADQVRVEVLPGPNDDLLREPVVADLASRLHQAMDAALAAPPGPSDDFGPS